jgi:lactate permease
MMFAAGMPVLFFIVHFVKTRSATPKGYIAYLFFVLIMVPFVILAWYTRELTGLLASVIMALIAYFFLFQNRNLQWKPWLPYFILIVLLLVPKVFPWFAELLAYKIQMSGIMGTEISASLQPFRSPLIPFLATALFALYRVNDYTLNFRPVLSRTGAVFLVLFPSLAITQLMLNSGGAIPSMIEAMSSVFVRSGQFYPFLSPVVGVLGSFISGSTTVSNLIFGSAQLTSAQALNMAPEIILSLQLTGASLGNAVCLFNIIAAAAVAGVKDYNTILKLNLLPILIACIVCALVSYGMFAFL